MNLDQRMTHEAGHRVQAFRNAHRTDIDWPVVSLEPFDEAVADLDAYDVEQYASTGTAKGETAVQKALRREIYKRFLGPIRTSAEFWKVNDSALIVDSYIERQGDWEMQVEALANAAEKQPTLLTEYMGRPDFVVELRAALAKLRASRVSRDTHWGNRSGATEGIEVAERNVRAKIRLLDGVLTPRLQDNLPLLAAWKSACRIHKTRIDPRPGGDATPGGNGDNPTG